MSAEASRYTADVNLRSVNDPHVLALGRVPAKSRVLDLGAADGSVAGVAREMGCRVWGVDIDPVAAEAARRVCEDVVVADLNQLDLAKAFEGLRFDIILMLDVLEHLTDPSAVLRRAVSVLAEGGWAIISVPNVAHISVRLSLLGGRFTYTDLGLLDRTHLRFFDRAAVDDLLHDAGWGMFELARVTRRFGTTEIRIDGADPDLVRKLESDIEGRTYQFIISAAPLDSDVLKDPPALPAAAAQAAYLEVEEELCGLRELRDAVVPRLQHESASLRATNRALQEEVKGLRNSKVIRWSRPARMMYYALRGHR